MHSALLQNKDNEADSYEIGKADNTSNGRHGAVFADQVVSEMFIAKSLLPKISLI